MVHMQLDGVDFVLREAFDFSFLAAYGRVFRVYDDQDSGNICFGCMREDERFFVKFAGAPTVRGSDDPAAAIARLRASVTVYRDLRHENLIELIEAREIGGGYAVIFRWTDGECMGRAYPASRAKFIAMPMETKLRVYRDILAFLVHTAAQGYVAVDFYDGSILYDFAAQKTLVCDVDFFRKMPAVNDMGRMWGSSRFMSPEEIELGAPLDEITNVCTAGAMAFALLADFRRERENWPLSGTLYDIAAKAVADNREDRWQSPAEMLAAWDTALL